MPTLQIKNIPSHLYQALERIAELEGRSLNQQVVIILAKELDIPLDFNERRKKLLENIKKESHFFEKWADVDVTSWVREDRENR